MAQAIFGWLIGKKTNPVLVNWLCHEQEKKNQQKCSYQIWSIFESKGDWWQIRVTNSKKKKSKDHYILGILSLNKFCEVMYSNGPPHMAEDDQLEHTYSSCMRIRDVAQKTCQKWWTIGKSGERGSGISVLAARHDDDDDEDKNVRLSTARQVKKNS